MCGGREGGWRVVGCSCTSLVAINIITAFVHGVVSNAWASGGEMECGFSPLFFVPCIFQVFAFAPFCITIHVYIFLHFLWSSSRECTPPKAYVYIYVHLYIFIYFSPTFLCCRPPVMTHKQSAAHHALSRVSVLIPYLKNV